MDYQCANCNTLFTSPYCPNCGQKAGTGRLTMHNIAHELWHGFTHTDKGVLKLWSDLLLRPASAYQNYFKGHRKNYFSPVVFFLLSFGLYIYADQQVFNYEDYIVQQRTGHLFNNEVGRFVQEHSKYIALSLLPLQALLTFLFFNRRYNLAECIAFWLFCVGFANTLLMLFTPIRLLLINQKEDVDFVLSLIVIVVYLWHLIALFGSDIWNMIKCVLIVLIISVANVYATFYFISMVATEYYPTLWDSLRIIFANRSPTFMSGKWIIK